MLMEVDNPRAVIGGNSPPEPTVIERAQDAITALGKFLNDVPVITDGPHLVEAKRLVDWVRGAAAELETERAELVRPLNDELDAINGKYKALHNKDAKRPGTLDKTLAELRDRLTAHGRAEEAKRETAALEAKRIADTAEAAAREAELIEQQAKMDAAVGVIDTGVAEAIADADDKFNDFKTASRFAARAEKQTTFRIGNGQGKALGMRTEKTLVLESYAKAITAIGKNEKIETAILSAARDYRKDNGKLPDGVTELSERKF